MKRLIDLTKDFEVSRPIFALSLGRSGDAVITNISNPVYKYRPTPIEGDYLSELVCQNYNESFNILDGNFVIDKHRIVHGAYRDWETDRKSTRLNSSHSAKSRMPSSA